LGCSLKGVILSEIKFISAKIDSFKDLTVVNINSVTPWPDVVVGRKKASYTAQNKPCQIPVTNNRYDLLSTSEKCGREIKSLSEMQQIKGGGKHNKKTLSKKQNKILILGDSHAKGCAQEVQHNLGHGFEVHGIVKPGAKAKTIVNTSTKITEKLIKKTL